ncbi:hypothetical protein LTR85_004324 [Meristemomyces frigidus]|nr:hypothetical protein LTR85_004324 [Meristemomyces frigidus]
MPLTTDQEVLKGAQESVKLLRAVAGEHPGYRPAHARGAILKGTFTPTAEAARLSSAPHFNQPTTDITARLSSATGFPTIPDTDPNANPRGFAIRFNLGEHVHTDIVAHSTPFFPSRTGPEFNELFHTLIASATTTESPTPLEKYLGSHPAALAFVTAPKPSPESLASEPYYSVSAFKFISKSGEQQYFRYRILPTMAVKTLSEEELKGKSPTYLFDELKTAIARGPLTFKLVAQLAEDEDVTDDATVQWPEDRRIVDLGHIELKHLEPEEESNKEQKKIIFDPMPRVLGIEESSDPLLDFRAQVYLISGKQRRQA